MPLSGTWSGAPSSVYRGYDGILYAAEMGADVINCSWGSTGFSQAAQDVVDYVKEHQDIQTGIRQGDRIIVRKIPYNPDAWIKEADPLLKRFHACHCPFSRFSILTQMPVPDLWCYCSGGFTKLFFDYLYERDLEVELLESVLPGGESCRFAIRLPE